MSFSSVDFLLEHFQQEFRRIFTAELLGERRERAIRQVRRMVGRAS
jgi:hypothetical protein